MPAKQSTLPLDFLDALRRVVGDDNLLTDTAECWSYGYDNSRRHHPPDAVAYATSHEQVATILRLCNRYEVPIVARGRGTGTTGATVPVGGGLVLALERMNQIRKVDPDNRMMIVEPGVTNQEIQQAAARHGFFWPPDPTSAAFCSVGGNLAYNSAGPKAVKYGTPRENTLGLRAVTGEGKELRTGVYTSKGVVGYDLTRLLIGSEGTLAVITEATLKLTPMPGATITLQAIYSDVASAAAAVSRLMAQPVTPCALEFMDGRAIDMIRDYAAVDLPATAGSLLMVEVDGAPECLANSLAAIEAAASGPGLVSLQTATTEEQVAELWRIRKALSPALRKIAPKKINEDVAVPVSRIPELIDGLDGLAKKHGITIVNFGHAGNGNIHVNLLVDPDNPQQMTSAEHCLSEVFDLVLSLDGTLSGEHGVGLEKRDFVSRELDPVALEMMRRIKRQFDPKGILNPGKMLPEES